VDVRVEVAEGEDLDVLHQLLDLGHAGEQRRHDHHRPLVRGDALPELEAREPPRGDQPRGQPLHERDGHVAGGQEQEEGHRRLHPRGRAVPPGVGDAEPGEEQGEDGDRAEVGAGGVAEHEAPHALAQPRPVGHVRLQVPAALPDEVVADVGGAVRDPCALRGLPRALHRAETDAHLGLARGVRELFHGLAVAVAAQEVHASVPAGRILLEHALHEAHRFEVLAPVQGRAQAQAGDHVRHRHLRRRLPLVLAADGVFRSDVLRGQVLFHRRAHRAQARPVLADALQDLDDERGVEDGGQRGHRALARAVDLGHVGVGGAPGRAALQDLVGQAPQVLDEGQLQHAGPGPQLADGERGHGLEGVHEAHELGPVQAAVAVADDLHRHRVDARRARLLAQGELGQLAVVAAGEVLAHVPDLGGHHVEVVEDPVRGRGDERALMDVVRHDAVRLVEGARVVLQPWEAVARPAARAAVQREAGGQRLRPFLETLDAQQLVAEGLLGARPQPPVQSPQQPVEILRQSSPF
jgi:hypothetical protein